MPSKNKGSVNRRGFLKGAAAGAAALVAKPGLAQPEAQAAQGQGRATAATPLPNAALVAAETSPPSPRADVYTTDRPGSDFMLDVIKSLGIEYCVANPGYTFRDLLESLLKYDRNKANANLIYQHEDRSGGSCY